jgi:hypothetical protein
LLGFGGLNDLVDQRRLGRDDRRLGRLLDLRATRREADTAARLIAALGLALVGLLLLGQTDPPPPVEHHTGHYGQREQHHNGNDDHDHGGRHAAILASPSQRRIWGEQPVLLCWWAGAVRPGSFSTGP